MLRNVLMILSNSSWKRLEARDWCVRNGGKRKVKDMVCFQMAG